MLPEISVSIKIKTNLKKCATIVWVLTYLKDSLLQVADRIYVMTAIFIITCTTRSYKPVHIQILIFIIIIIIIIIIILFYLFFFFNCTNRCIFTRLINCKKPLICCTCISDTPEPRSIIISSCQIVREREQSLKVLGRGKAF